MTNKVEFRETDTQFLGRKKSLEEISRAENCKVKMFWLSEGFSILRTSGEVVFESVDAYYETRKNRFNRKAV